MHKKVYNYCNSYSLCATHRVTSEFVVRAMQLGKLLDIRFFHL